MRSTPPIAGSSSHRYNTGVAEKRKVIRENKKAFHNYEILDRHEAGIALMGSEVKSLRDGRVSIEESFCKFRGEELYLVNMDISPYKAAALMNHEPKRARKLLMHKSELRRLLGKMRERRFTMVPLKIYFNDKGLAKVEVALARGKTQYDKRRALKERELERKLRRYRR